MYVKIEAGADFGQGSAPKATAQKPIREQRAVEREVPFQIPPKDSRAALHFDAGLGTAGVAAGRVRGG